MTQQVIPLPLSLPFFPPTFAHNNQSNFNVYLSIYRITDSLQGYHEKRLLNNLLMNYNLLERPVANEADPLEVRFGLTLQQIIDVVSWKICFL